MKHVISKDGTRIAYERSGTGPPLVLVHGTGIDHSYWDLLVPILATDFTVYAVDRRGRGQSGDTLPYALQREFEDVVALVNSIREPVTVFGHSYGALCALEAVTFRSHIRKLILYEPPMYTTIEVSYPPDILAKYESLLRDGKAEEALLMLYQVGQTPAADVNRFKSLPSWQARVLAANTIPREVLSVRSYCFDPARFRGLTTPILFLIGSETLPVYNAATQVLHGSLPHSRVVILPNQSHDAAVTAPKLVLREVSGYFGDLSPEDALL